MKLMPILILLLAAWPVQSQIRHKDPYSDYMTERLPVSRAVHGTAGGADTRHDRTFFECDYIRPASADRPPPNDSRTAALTCVYSNDGGIYHIRMSPAEGRWLIRRIEQKGCWVQ